MRCMDSCLLYTSSYSPPKGAKTSTSHVGPAQYGKTMYHKDTPQIFSATGIPYIATVGENQPADFIKKAAKAARYAQSHGMAYIKALSACPLNWNDNPRYERSVIDAGVNCCYHPLYEIEDGITTQMCIRDRASWDAKPTREPPGTLTGC